MAGDYPALHRLESALQPLTANLTGPFYMTIVGTVNTIGGGTGGTSSIDESTFTTGGTSLTPMGALALNIGADPNASMATGRVGAPKMSSQRILFSALATPSGGDVMDNTNTAVRVNVVAGGAGGGAAQVQVQGTGGNWLAVGYQSGPAALPNGNNLPIVFGSGNVPSMGVSGLGGSMGVTQIGAPWSVTGSQGVTQLGAPWSVTGSQGVTQLGAPWSMVGSVNAVLGTLPVPMVGSVNTTPLGVQVVDTRGSLSPTQWIISFGGSGQSANITGSVAAQRAYFSSYHLVATATLDLQWNSPSGVAISGSFRVLPGAGFALAGNMPAGPVLIGSQGSSVFLAGNAVGNVGGVGIGWFAA